MIDFIIAGAIYLTMMFIVLFSLSFVTIGITYAMATGFKRLLHWNRTTQLALK